MSDQKEIERLKKLRERQLSARDPGVYERKVQGQIARKAHKVRSKQNFWKDSAKEAPKALWGFLIGAGLGLIILLILGVMLPPLTAGLFGILAMLLLGILGALLGASFDWRDELKRTLK
jgi:Flp pilus assembly protein TadB